MNKIEILKETVLQVRRDILRMVHKVNSGHPRFNDNHDLRVTYSSQLNLPLGLGKS